MNKTEAAALCRFVKAACPQQAFDEYTPAAWAELLVDIRIEDAHEAVVEHVRRSPWVSPSEIITAVKQLRLNRLHDFGPLPDPPSELSPSEYANWMYATTRAIGDGDGARFVKPGTVIDRDGQMRLARMLTDASQSHRNGPRSDPAPKSEYLYVRDSADAPTGRNEQLDNRDNTHPDMTPSAHHNPGDMQ